MVLVSQHCVQHVQRCKGFVSNIIALGGDCGWILYHNDIVHLGSDPAPYKVFSMGYGDHQREIRFARLHEGTSAWSSGRWVSTAQLAVDNHHLAVQGCMAASSDENVLMNGRKIVYKGRHH